MKQFFFILALVFSQALLAAFRPLDPELKDYPYPFPVQFHEVKYKDQKLKMAFMRVKPEKANGKIIVLLHGKNFSGAYWEKTAQVLSKDGYELLIPDQIGFGKSSKPDSFAFSFHYLSQLTQELLIQQNIKEYILIGHSMGGMLATRMALMYPESVLKLLLVNPIGLEDWKVKVPYRDVNTNFANELKSTENSIRDYQKLAYFDGKWKPEYEKAIEIQVGWSLHPEYKKIAWNAALTTDMVFTQPIIYEISNLRMPTLLLIGTRDRTAVGKAWATPEVQKELGRYDLLGKKFIEKIPKGKLVELQGIGHMPQVEDFETYIRELKAFL